MCLLRCIWGNKYCLHRRLCFFPSLIFDILISYLDTFPVLIKCWLPFSEASLLTPSRTTYRIPHCQCGLHDLLLGPFSLFHPGGLISLPTSWLSTASAQHHISFHHTLGPTTHVAQSTFPKQKNTEYATNGTQEPLEAVTLPGEWQEARTWSRGKTVHLR